MREVKLAIIKIPKTVIIQSGETDSSDNIVQTFGFVKLTYLSILTDINFKGK